MARPLITLTTDFGFGSSYVAQMKGVLLSICREADLVDISHVVRPQNIREGAILLADSTPPFPPATIHVAVIDPGVGTARPLVLAEIGGQRYLAPDNGLLSLLASRQPPQRIIGLENPRYWLPKLSHTFHGRDILAPVAAHLACGVDPAELGPPRSGLVMLDWPQPRRLPGGIAGQVLYVDGFGNAITNIELEALAALAEMQSLVVECGKRRINGVVPTYGAALPGELVALIDSQGRLEVAVVQGSAAEQLQLKPGDPVVVSSGP